MHEYSVFAEWDVGRWPIPEQIDHLVDTLYESSDGTSILSVMNPADEFGRHGWLGVRSMVALDDVDERGSVQMHRVALLEHIRLCLRAFEKCGIDADTKGLRVIEVSRYDALSQELGELIEAFVGPLALSLD